MNDILKIFIISLVWILIVWAWIFYEANQREALKNECLKEIAPHVPGISPEKLDQYAYECADGKRGFRSAVP